MIKIKLTNEKDDTYGIEIDAKDSCPAEFFYVINRCFEVIAEQTNTDVKQVEKIYKKTKKFIKE